MKHRCEFVRGSVVLSLLLVATPVLADESAPNTEFTYTDDWAFVSAPPPPGPYRAVNIDPRVPGVDAIPPLPMEPVTAPARDGIPEDAMANPPAAGIPATRPTQDRPASAMETQQLTPPAMPAQAEHLAPFPPGQYYPAKPRYPAQTYSAPPAGYPGYRKQPAYGYFGSPVYPQEQQTVPPPPVYDAQMRNRHPTGRGSP
jgi:hypothetical protein